MNRSRQRIAVVGAGIVGVTMAWHLARRGADVTLIDAGQPGGGVTSRAFGWINVAHDQPEPLMALRHLATHEWRRMQREVGEALQIDWCGGLTWRRDPAATQRLAREHAACGYDVRLMERAELAAREPNLIEPPEVAAFAPIEGAIEAGAMTAVIARAAVEAGVTVRYGCAAEALETRGGSVTGVRTADGAVAADTVVLAAGTGSPALAQGFGPALPVAPSPAILLRFRAPQRLVHTIMTGPAMEVRHGGDSRLTAAEDYPEDGDVARIAREALAAIRGALRGTETLEIESAEAGWRPMPADGLPHLGFQPDINGLYIMAMHAGVTLAPTVSRLATAEIVDGIAVAMLDDLRPGRSAA